MIGTLMGPRDVQVRGWLALTELPDDVQAAEDATAAADTERIRTGTGGIPTGFRSFKRVATDTERLLLQDLGHTLPQETLWTHVHYKHVARYRSWPQIEEQENTNG